jgi:hypothetical protein
LPKDFEQYDAEVIDNTKLSPSGISGSKQFNYLVIPRHHGKYELPEVVFTYYDLTSKKYQTLTAQGTTITVQKGEGNSSFVGHAATEKTDVTLLNQDIRHIQYSTKLRSVDESFFGSTTYWLLLGAPFIWLGGFFMFGRIRKTESDDKSQRNASKIAIKLLAEAQKQLDNKDDKAFYAAMDKALHDFLSIRCKLPVSSLNRLSIESNLRLNNVPEHAILQLNQLLEECAMARFAPTTLQGASSSMNHAVETIKTIEKYVK